MLRALWPGPGDVKLMAATGLWVGVGGLPVLLFLSGAVGICNAAAAGLGGQEGSIGIAV